jgi:hypothetical protein
MSKPVLKNTTVRLEPDVLEILQELARLHGEAPSDLIRGAIMDYISRCANGEDEADSKLVAEVIERQVARVREERLRMIGLQTPPAVRTP